MGAVTQQKLDDYRARTFHRLPRLRLHFERDAIRFVNERGFVFFWPVKNMLLPSLWGAVAGDRPVADNHDDPAHITWRWKDNLLGKKKCYYARVLRKRNTFISLEALPYFYALSLNYGDPENDYLIQYHQGLLPMEAKSVFEALLREGPLDILALKRAANLSSPGNESRFNRALDILQADFRILPIGIAEAGTWKYAFIYEAVHRHFPELIRLSRSVSECAARQYLLKTYLKTVGACPINEPQRLFRWKDIEFEPAVETLINEGVFSKGAFFADSSLEWLAHADLLR